MDWTTAVRSQQADFIQKRKITTINGIQRLSKLALSIFLALLISMTGVVIPGVPLLNNEVAEALPVNKILSPSRVKHTLRFLGKAGRVAIPISSFLPDISFNASLAPTLAFSPTGVFAPTLAFSPTLSLIGRIDFFFNIQEINFIKFDIDKKPYSPATDAYNLGVNKIKDERDYKGAVKHYSDALSRDGNFAEAHVSRGRAYSELGEQQRAIADYTKAMSVKPKFAEDSDRYVEPLLGRGAVYIKLGNYQAALDDFNLAIQRNPDFKDAYLSRATIYIRQKDYQKAIEDLNEALALTADDYTAAFFRRGSIWGEVGEYERAIEDFNKVIENQGEDSKHYYTAAYYKRGLAYLNLGEEEKALDNLNEAINHDPNYREAYYNRGIIYERHGNYKKAINNYSKALLIYNITVSSWHEAAVHSVAISPDDEIIASGSVEVVTQLLSCGIGKLEKSFVV